MRILWLLLAIFTIYLSLEISFWFFILECVFLTLLGADVGLDDLKRLFKRSESLKKMHERRSMEIESILAQMKKFDYEFSGGWSESLNIEEKKDDIEKYYVQNEKYVSDVLDKNPQIYITNSTMQELKNKKEGKADIEYSGYKRPIRPKLVFHLSYNCALGLKDFEVNGVVVAYNSGLIVAEFDKMLLLCKCCGYEHQTPCNRCGSYGHLPHFKHVEGGVCFKCDGVGYLN